MALSVGLRPLFADAGRGQHLVLADGREAVRTEGPGACRGRSQGDETDAEDQQQQSHYLVHNAPLSYVMKGTVLGQNRGDSGSEAIIAHIV